MFNADQLQEKWAPIMEAQEAPAFADAHRRSVTAVVLENTEKALAEERGQQQYINEAAPTNATGSAVSNWDPVLISLVRRAMPNLIAFDLAGVQPMSGPTGLIFAMKSRYNNQTGDEALHDTINDSFSGPRATADAEAQGSGAVGDDAFAEMAFSIEKATVTAKSRALKAEYTMELAQDLKAVHGLDAESELATILSSEILAEMNREVVNTVNAKAKTGAQGLTTDGTFDLDADSDGRWSVEKHKGLLLQIQKEANKIALDTRRGKGNFLLVSADVAAILSASGMLDSVPALQGNAGISSDVTGTTFAGVLSGGIKVYLDPYATANYVTVGYKGSSAYDAGLFYCPYVPLTMVRAVGEQTFQPKIGFKTRYGMVANPFVATDGTTGANDANPYYRTFLVTNI